MSETLSVIDYHCHHVPSRFDVTAMKTAPPSQRERWKRTADLLGDEGLLLRAIEDGDLKARIVNVPGQQIADEAGHVAHDVLQAVNDELAALVARHPGRIYAMATVDGYDGEQSAREVERAIGQLGLRGVFVDCARGDKLIDAPEARPTLAAAARLGVPVFVHPINPYPLITQMEPYGRAGTLLARGTVNSCALVALVESGVFEELPDLKVVVTALAVGGLAMLGGFAGMSRRPDTMSDTLRRNVYIDTMEFDATLIRAAVGYLGAGHVLAGSDWPIVNEGPIAGKLASALDQCGLSREEKQMIAGGNALRLLGVA